MLDTRDPSCAIFGDVLFFDFAACVLGLWSKIYRSAADPETPRRLRERKTSGTQGNSYTCAGLFRK